MATMVTSTRPATKKSIGGGPKLPGPDGNGRNGHDDHFSRSDSSARRYRIGIWVALASIIMIFTSLTSAYIVRAASANDWQPLPMPRVLLLSTALIIVSSFTLEAARRNLRGALQNKYLQWLWITAAFGCCFLITQLLAWRQLVRQGVYIATNPHSSFFFLLTAVHGLHLVGGLTALVYLVVRSRRKQIDEVSIAKGQAAVDAAALYWHFMDGLWIYLFLLLFFWR